MKSDLPNEFIAYANFKKTCCKDLKKKIVENNEIVSLNVENFVHKFNSYECT